MSGEIYLQLKRKSFNVSKFIIEYFGNIKNCLFTCVRLLMFLLLLLLFDFIVVVVGVLVSLLCHTDYLQSVFFYFSQYV